ncbi:hypothetical protein [Myroides odoratus]|uniref:hypothetical protein n=1 Tax=Myroides odoratus TaxID=256 RepID=UPI000AA40D5C|nr:hypothetical protein [Myroides odoratus]
MRIKKPIFTLTNTKKTMNQTPKLTYALHSSSLLSALLILSFTFLSRMGANGIYTYPLLGALYELLWFPLLAALFSIPIVWFVLACRKKAAWTKLILPCILSAGTIAYLILSQ